MIVICFKFAIFEWKQENRENENKNEEIYNLGLPAGGVAAARVSAARKMRTIKVHSRMMNDGQEAQLNDDALYPQQLEMEGGNKKGSE